MWPRVSLECEKPHVLYLSGTSLVFESDHANIWVLTWLFPSVTTFTFGGDHDQFWKRKSVKYLSVTNLIFEWNLVCIWVCSCLYLSVITVIFECDKTYKMSGIALIYLSVTRVTSLMIIFDCDIFQFIFKWNVFGIECDNTHHMLEFYHGYFRVRQHLWNECYRFYYNLILIKKKKNLNESGFCLSATTPIFACDAYIRVLNSLNGDTHITILLNELSFLNIFQCDLAYILVTTFKFEYFHANIWV